MRFVRVALDVPLSTLFDYFLPESLGAMVGQRVVVPFGRQQVVGVVMECLAETNVPAERIKSVLQALDDVPPLPADTLKLLRFCSDYYQHPLGMTVLSALPARMRSREPVVLKRALTYGLSESGRALDLEHLPKRKVVQRRILEALQHGTLSTHQVRALATNAMATLKSLLEAGWVEETALAPASGRGAGGEVTFNNPHSLTAEQQRAVDAVSQAQAYRCFLLHGITGSGKTEIYVHLMHEMLQRGGQVLLLVP